VSIKNPTKNQGRTLVLWKDEQFLLRHWHPSCTSKPSDISGMRKVPDCDYDNRNISVVIWESDLFLTSHFPVLQLLSIKYINLILNDD
jgi:hypothetical protein